MAALFIHGSPWCSAFIPQHELANVVCAERVLLKRRVLQKQSILLFLGTTDPPLTKTNEDAVRSLLVITGSPPSNPAYEAFKETVSLYGEREPFNFPNPFNYPRKVRISIKLNENINCIYNTFKHKTDT